MESASPRDHLDSDLLLGLDPERIVYTISKLERRIEERFPGASLAKVCGRLVGIAEKTVSRLDRVAKPILWLGAGTWMMASLVVMGFVTLLARVVSTPDLPGGVDSALTLLQALETGMQDVVFVGLALAFLISAENRIKRGRALRYMRELRAMAHIVDMHQLTKDPGRLIRPAGETESSPDRTHGRRTGPLSGLLLRDVVDDRQDRSALRRTLQRQRGASGGRRGGGAHDWAEPENLAEDHDSRRTARSGGQPTGRVDGQLGQLQARLGGKQLGRYLDYCSEMLSMTAKIAALYAERFSDNVVLQAVDEVEALTTGLSRKIWQKIMILDGPLGAEASPPVE